jgi:hypothetical protein
VDQDSLARVVLEPLAVTGQQFGTEQHGVDAERPEGVHGDLEAREQVHGDRMGEGTLHGHGLS